jgi:hypothetical protein
LGLELAARRSMMPAAQTVPQEATVRSRTTVAALAAALALTCVPATAHAAVSAKVTGDDGNPADLTPGAALPIRNINVRVNAHHDKVDDESWRFTVTDPSGVTATSIGSYCWTSILDDDSRVIWRGNGTYTVTLTTYKGTKCEGTPRSTTTYQYTVAASVAVAPPAGPVMTRAANSFTTNTQQLGLAGNPGADTYEIRYAKGGVIGPDGAISGPSETAYVDSATGQIQLTNISSPGSYVVVARARSGEYYTAWSAPVTLTAIAPFDLTTRTFPDTRGPRYSVRGVVREPSAAGKRVTISAAKGKKGKRFRRLGKAKVNRKGVFKLRFTIRKRGVYRLRYRFPGNATVARGTILETVRIRRVIV